MDSQPINPDLRNNPENFLFSSLKLYLRPFLCVRLVDVLARLRGCSSSSLPSLLDYAIHTLTGSSTLTLTFKC